MSVRHTDLQHPRNHRVEGAQRITPEVMTLGIYHLALNPHSGQPAAWPWQDLGSLFTQSLDFCICRKGHYCHIYRKYLCTCRKGEYPS